MLGQPLPRQRGQALHLFPEGTKAGVQIADLNQRDDAEDGTGEEDNEAEGKERFHCINLAPLRRSVELGKSPLP
jgi:hypothetical protein